MNIENYFNDGACWQSQMVLAHLRAHLGAIIEQTWNGRAYDTETLVGRFENGREQGYVFSIIIPYFESKDKEVHQKNWAVFEHRNSDDICVLTSDSFTINTPTIEQMYEGRDKFTAYEKIFLENEVVLCSEYLIAEMREFVREHYENERK